MTDGIILNWPVVGLVLGLAIILLFKRPFTDLIDRLTKLGRDGIEARIPQQTQPQLSAPEAENALSEFNKTWENPLRMELETAIRKDLETRKLTAAQDREGALIRSLAAAQIAFHFERVYSLIFSSQMAILVHLISSNDDGVPLMSLQPFYEQGAKQNPEFYKDYSFDHYMGFLEGQSLINRSGDRVALTQSGREFLKWLVDTKKSMPLNP